MLTRKQTEEKLAQVFSPAQATALADILEDLQRAELERAADTRELKQGLIALTTEVRTLTGNMAELAEAQQRTEQHVAELAEAQRRTEERVTELAEAQQRTEQHVAELAEAQRRTEQHVAELAEAQRRTEERLGILEQRVTELAEAQQRTEQRVAELAEAQRRTEERLGILEQRVTELAEAQQRTDESLARLSQVVEIGFRELHQAIGNLVNRFGFDLEEFVAALLPPYLEKHLGISRLELERRYFDLGNGQIEEVDLAGVGQRAGRPVMVLVECRTTIRGSEAQKVVNKLQAIRATLKEEVEMVIVAMNIHPTAKTVGEAGGVRMVPYSRINRPGDFAE